MEKTKAINSTQIARLAGVSRSTVSKVINNYPDIPEETKNKVRAVITEHRYTPNDSARVLRGKAQSVIALYVYASAVDVEEDALCRLSSPYVMGVISSFIAEAKKFGHRMMIELIKYGEDEQEVLYQIQNQFESKSIAAAVFLGVPEGIDFVDQLVNDNYPIVALDRQLPKGKQGISVFTDDVKGAEIAIRHLVDQGFKRILFVCGDDNKSSAAARERGYRKAMAELGREPDIMTGGFSGKFGIQAADKIIAMASAPDAVLCACDAQAYGLMQRLQELKPELLKRLGIVGFDDSFFNDFQQPPLSSIKVDFSAMAGLAIKVLLEPEKKSISKIPVELVSRKSSLKR